MQSYMNEIQTNAAKIVSNPTQSNTYGVLFNDSFIHYSAKVFKFYSKCFIWTAAL